jgi:hypothetical protein
MTSIPAWDTASGGGEVIAVGLSGPLLATRNADAPEASGIGAGRCTARSECG